MITVRFNNEFGRNIAAVGFNGCSLATLPAVICSHRVASAAARVEVMITRKGARAGSPAYREYLQRHLAAHGLYLSRIVEQNVKFDGRAPSRLRAAFAH